MNMTKFSLCLCCILLIWLKADNAMATCALTSAISEADVNNNYVFPTNSNGTSVDSVWTATPFWSGSADETYSCPRDASLIGFCGTDDQYMAGGIATSFGPGIFGGAFVSNGNVTTGSYKGCFYLNKGSFKAQGTVPPGLSIWKYVEVGLKITDSTQARNITLDHKLAGYLYMVNEDYGDRTIGGAPLTRVYVSGTISIPAACTLASNSVVVLPDTYSGDYGKAGPGAKIGTGTTQPMSIKCSGGSASATIDLHVTTNKMSGDDIVTSNPDVGVRVLDSNGNAVSANNGKVSATLNDGAVDVPFTYAPVAITGKNPAPGDYSAIETITVTIP